ncbi:MAG: cytochrome c biogenesis CcdA family protein [Anaerolineae bacterium]
MGIGFFLTTFWLGLLTPLTAPCVLPLYPAYLARLVREAGHERQDRRILGLIGVIVSAGVLVFMAIVGLLFTTLFQRSLSRVIAIVSPIAFGVLAIAGVLLMLGITPKIKVRPVLPNKPLLGAFLYGLFFGAIVIPCNPALIAFFFSRAGTVVEFGANMLNFLAFGLGIATPLLVLSLITRAASRWVVTNMVRYQRPLDIIAGAIITGVSLYYLVFVFEIFGKIG